MAGANVALFDQARPGFKLFVLAIFPVAIVI
jgi:hypothetical protein